MKLLESLIFTEEIVEYSSLLNTTQIKGSYNTMQFVLRLRDDVRLALDNKDNLSESVQASSTSLHENIHWWQHIGSNFGFLISLAYPAFAHLSIDNLQNLISNKIAYKSLLKFDREYVKKYQKADIEDLNNILNNYYDMEYAKLFALDNTNIYNIIKDKRFFMNIGHCYLILWSSTLHVIASTIDEKFNFLPNIDNWFSEFARMNKEKIKGFYVDSPMTIAPIGIKAIYEGQAIFSQLQYLTVVSNNKIRYADFEEVGMLYGIYLEAFEKFLSIIKYEKPSNLLEPIVGLFLLVCDLSINPNNGFPLDIYDYEGFITKNDPGSRFIHLSIVIAEDPDEYVSRIGGYSKEEYIYLSKILSEKIGCKCPYESISTVLSWGKEEKVMKILDEESELNFSEENLPIRLMFSKYYRFQEDKYACPHIFCWFGFHSRPLDSNVESNVTNDLFKKHHALFTDHYDNEIKAVEFEGRTKENILKSFKSFYKYCILYELVLKWVTEEGKFKLDYRWLVGEREDEIIPYVDKYFQDIFGISIDDIEVL